MDYFKAAVILNQLIKSTNNKLLAQYKTGIVEEKQMAIRSNFGKIIYQSVSKTNLEFVKKNIEEFNSEAFVISDFIISHSNNSEMTYFIYKGFHKLIDKGLIFYQLVDKYNLNPIGDLQFNGFEENIFYTVDAPNFKECTYEVLERDENTIKAPSIDFMIVYKVEERLIYDLQRLIFKAANNALKHKKCMYKFHVRITALDSKISSQFIAEVEAISKTLQQILAPEYPNSTFIFELDKD